MYRLGCYDLAMTERFDYKLKAEYDEKERTKNNPWNKALKIHFLSQKHVIANKNSWLTKIEHKTKRSYKILIQSCERTRNYNYQ